MTTQPDNTNQSELSPDSLDRVLKLAAAARRLKREALRLYRARPETVPFHASRAMVYMLRGGNRSGKSTAAAAEFASVVTGMPIHGPNGEVISPPRVTGRPLRTWIIGIDLKHIGQTIHRLLFEPGLFRTIKDRETGEMRSWRPWEEEDRDRQGETKPSEPLIPKRFIDPNGWAWEDRAQNIFNQCKLRNGTYIFGFGSRSMAKQGDAVDFIWIDEDIERPDHVNEWIMRLPDLNGRLIWSAMPHERNDALIKLSDKASAEADMPNPTTTEVQLTFSGNPFLGEKEKNTALTFLDDDERRRRDLGDYDKAGRLVFPSYSDTLHGMDLSEFMDVYRGGPDWCRYMACDPGWARCAATFWAISPPEVNPPIILLEDELYLEHCGAKGFAEAVVGKINGRCYQSFIIDWHGSRITEMGSGQTVVAQFVAEFRRLQIRSMATGHEFEQGSDDVDARILAFRKWLALTEDYFPLFRNIRQQTLNFQKEIGRYKRKIGMQGEILEKPDDRFWSHLMVTAQYFAAAMTQEGREIWIRPRSMKNLYLTETQKYLQRKRDEERRRRGGSFVNLGPSGDDARVYEYM